MNDESIMPFGKYKGEKLANVPSSYLLWLFEEGKCYGDLRAYVNENMDAIKADIEYQKKTEGGRETKCPECGSIFIMKHQYDDRYKICMSCKHNWKE